MINFNSPERVSRIAKSAKASLAAAGHDRAFSAIREALSRSFGYRGWNDLMSRSAGELPDENTARLWASNAASTIASELDVPVTLVQPLLEQISGLIARRKGWTWEAAAARIAASMTAEAERIVEVSFGDLAGVRLIEKPDTSRQSWCFNLLVSEDGTRFHSSTTLFKDMLPELDTEKSIHADLLGIRFQERGMHGHDEELRSGPVFDTLMRLDPVAMFRLRAAPHFGTDSYDLIRSLPEDSHFIKMLDRFPGLAAIVTHVAHSERSEDISDPQIGRLVLEADDPVDALVTTAVNYGAGQRPRYPVPREGARKIIEHLCASELPLNYDGIASWNVSVLAHCPQYLYPKSREEMFHAMHVGEISTGILQSGRIDPAHLFRELEEMGGDWARFQKEVSESALGLIVFGSDVADVIISKLLADHDIDDPDVYSDGEASYEVGEALKIRIVEGRGPLEVYEAMSRWSAPYDQDVDWTPDQRFSMLQQSGLLPADLATLSAEDIIHVLGFDVDSLLDGVAERARPVLMH